MNVAVSEALATGLPAVLTRHSGFPDQVKDGVNGYLAEEGNPESIANTLAKYLDNPERWPQMSRMAREHAVAQYDRKRLIEMQVGLYQKLVTSRSAKEKL